jgi:Zn-dependent protease with chaperone function
MLQVPASLTAATDRAYVLVADCVGLVSKNGRSAVGGKADALWISKGEEIMNQSVNRSQSAAAIRHREIATGIRPLPNLFVRSISLLCVLYGSLTLLLITAVELGFFSASQALISGIIFAIVQFVVSPWLIDLSLRFLYKVEWVDKNALPEHVQLITQGVCDTYSFRFPSFGIINDGAPQAFTYGHYPSNARIVLSTGTLNLLTADEVDTVVAHELGHIRHWDMVIMTIAQLVPLIAYYIYRAAADMAQSGKKRGGAAIIVSIGAYLVYVMSQFLVLWFSRTREYYADRFAAETTKNPNGLASGLVKIGYGLAASGSSKPGNDTSARRAHGVGFGALNIFDRRSALNLVVSSGPSGTSGEFDKVALKGALQWDLWNPWASFFEIQSTHPLIAKRLERLGDQAVSLRQDPLVVFDTVKPESYWDEFVVDAVVTLLPVIGVIVGGVLVFALGSFGHFNPRWLGLILCITGAAMIIKTRMAYRHGSYPKKTVAELLQEVKVSPVRPVPATIHGTVIGKGVPGLIWSEDFVVRDQSGIIFLDYRQPLKIWEWLFGLLKAGKFQGEQVSIEGWFRRSPVPYLEIGSLKIDGEASARTCYVRHVKLITGAVIFALGLLAFLA